MPASRPVGFREPDWGAVKSNLRSIHRQILDLRRALVPYTGGFRNRGDSIHDALHDLAYQLGAPENFLHDEKEQAG